MRLTFLGTGAAEGVPSPFCSCATCTYTRAMQGRNVRKRASLLVNNDLIIDIGPDMVWSCTSLGLSLAELKYALITHSHFDHFYPHNLEIRSSPYLDDQPLHLLTLVAGPSTLRLLDGIGYSNAAMSLKRQPLFPYQSIELAPYTITSVAATHALDLGDAMNYIIDDGASRILYATDTGLFSTTTWEMLMATPPHLVILDVTNGMGETSVNHLNIDGLRQTLSGFARRDMLVAVYATHFSHHSHPPHVDIAGILSLMGVTCAFDGLALDVDTVAKTYK